MNIIYEDYSKLRQFSHTDLAYINQDESLQKYCAYEATKDSIGEVINCRKKYAVDRHLLLRVLKKQYGELDLVLPINDDELLDENTFTVTTAHQPTLLTGPLFQIYKISSIIHLADDLNKTYPGQKFVPVFIMSGEDHDWEEVNHFYLFGKKYEWDRNASGPCGRLSLDGLQQLIDAVQELFKNSFFGKEISEVLINSLNKAKNYGEFHTLLIAALFEGTGLIILDPDDMELKKSFIPVMEKEIKEKFSYQHVPVTQSELEKDGFKVQAYCREINLFYMADDLRERIDPLPDGVMRVGSGVKYSMQEILNELHAHPDRFSPNVILRPLYQEYILPNLAYVGGGGEIAYWLERKKQFEAAGVHYPMLIRRNSFLIVDASTNKQLSKLDLEWNDVIDDINSIINAYLHKHSRIDLHFNDEMKKIHEAYHDLAGKAEKLDPTLSTAILAEGSKQSKIFEQLGSRLIRTEKQQQETQIKRIQRIKDKLFPDGGLQERHENFLSYYADEGPAWIENIISISDPWIAKFIVVEQSK